MMSQSAALAFLVASAYPYFYSGRASRLVQANTLALELALASWGPVFGFHLVVVYHSPWFTSWRKKNENESWQKRKQAWS